MLGDRRPFLPTRFATKVNRAIQTLAVLADYGTRRFGDSFVIVPPRRHDRRSVAVVSSCSGSRVACKSSVAQPARLPPQYLSPRYPEGFAGTRECVSRVPAERITTFRYGVGRGNGVGRGRGVTLGVALGVAVGVTVGVAVGVTVVVGVGVTVAVAVGVGVGVGVAPAAQKISIEASGVPAVS